MYVIINTITKYRINKDKMKEEKVMKIAKKALKTIPKTVNIKQYLGKSIRLITTPEDAAIPFPPLNLR